MARSKAFLFEEDEQLGSRLCMAMSHPAKIRMMRRLKSNGVVSYAELIADIPLAESSITQHLNTIKRLGFTKPVLMGDGNAGYRLNVELYRSCAEASRQQMRGEGRIITLPVVDEDCAAEGGEI